MITSLPLDKYLSTIISIKLTIPTQSIHNHQELLLGSLACNQSATNQQPSSSSSATTAGSSSSSSGAAGPSPKAGAEPKRSSLGRVRPSGCRRCSRRATSGMRIEHISYSMHLASSSCVPYLTRSSSLVQKRPSLERPKFWCSLHRGVSATIARRDETRACVRSELIPGLLGIGRTLGAHVDDDDIAARLVHVVRLLELLVVRHQALDGLDRQLVATHTHSISLLRMQVSLSLAYLLMDK